MINDEQIIVFLLNRAEKLNKRYIEAEQFIMKLTWFDKLFCSRKIKKFLKSRLDNYDF